MAETDHYWPREPALHRRVTAADAADPSDATVAADSLDRRNIRFDIDTSGSTYLTALTVQVLFWNELARKWFGGDSWVLDAAALAATPNPAIDVETRGAKCFLKVRSATAYDLDLTIYATAW